MFRMRENVVSAAIGSVSGIFGALLVVALHRGLGGVEAGDVLSFFGAIVGTGLAVAGAVWVEERKRKTQIADGSRPILDALMALERRSRDFFDEPGQRRGHRDLITIPLERLKRLLALSPPRSAQLIGLFDRLDDGAAILTGEMYSLMDEQAPMASSPERHRVEALLESFDGPLKLLIVEYSRLINPKAVRSVAHLGSMPEV